MDKLKQIENIRKRNAELNQQLNDLKLKIENENKSNIESHEKVDDLIIELESLKNEWRESLDKLKGYEIQYLELISQLKEIKKTMVSMGFTISWYQKIILKIKKLFKKDNNVRDN